MKADESFFTKVFEVVKLIPKGRVTSYGAIAKYIGSAGSSRMVGWAMNASHSNREFIPAHRVVNRNGELTGKFHFPGEFLMEELLTSEGIEISNDRIKNFKSVYWDPNLELNQ